MSDRDDSPIQRVRDSARKLLLGTARDVFGEYQFFRIYRLDLDPGAPSVTQAADLRAITDPTELFASDDKDLRRLGKAAGPEALGFGLWADGRLVTAAWVWSHRRFGRHDIWTLKPGEQMLVEVATHQLSRGRGYGRLVLRYAAGQMQKRGAKRMYASIWHSNIPSISSFEAAGWRHVADVNQIFPLGGELRWLRKRVTNP